jgi:chromosome segregation protein
MRLTKLKLAGFKSFVDPTSVALPGQLVGVVGPNGCGKSNIMDAVRWVLGESKASELRGESMMDVIFNGSTNRKPVSRASVELIFDNSLGRAAGQWSQYAELAVKRVLTRSGDSEYYLNNLRVRRKDITDVFLGTGLGPRAYAIIGQGMISRIIEARPEELRVFLEEAAGVTRYKERRKETQGRIEDTRENLTRVDDIRQELAGQMERLEGQAVVARQYHDLNGSLTRKQQLLWLLKRNEAEAERQRVMRDIEQATNNLEEQMAALRETEARLEEAREAHFASSDGVHQAQGGFYNASAEVTRLETEIRLHREQQRQLESRLIQLEGEETHWREQAEQGEEEANRWQELALLAEERVEQGEMKLEGRRERMPLAEEANAGALEEVTAQRGRIAQAEQQFQVEQTHRAHAERSLQSITQRRERLEGEKKSLHQPDTGELDMQQEELAMLREELALKQEELASIQQELPQLENVRREAQQALQAASKERAEAQARRGALEQLQQRVQSGNKLGEWLKRHGLDAATPLWKQIHVASGWEEAVEAVLRERLNAIAAGDTALAGLAEDKPGAKLTLLIGGEPAASTLADGLAAQIRCEDASLQAVIAGWLVGVRACDSLEQALARRSELQGGEVWACRAGHLVDRASVTLFAPDTAEHGLLERQREIEQLAETLESQQGAVDAAQEQLAEIETRLSDAQAKVQVGRAQTQEMQNRVHAMQMDTLKLSQAVERFRERHSQIETQLADLIAEEEVERERAAQAEETIAEVRESMDHLHTLLATARGRQEQTERALRDEREALAAAEREVQEANFSQRECTAKLQEIAANRELAARQLARVIEERRQGREASAGSQVDALEPLLQEALELRVEREQALAASRDALEMATATLRTLEEQRMKIEQALDPLRQRINELRLKEQAAALNVEQMAAQLVEAKADEAALAEELAGAKVSSLQGSINALQKALTELGAVNLAALDELDAARQRKEFLDAQADDLTQAMDTLENAIRRIDRETRELLQSTYDTVNGHFGTLFPTLFGGGRAELVMTGDEILDAGIQVVAQPPGKKNSTIHLLSGGEKALTAIALVFSLFSLNPAPFCLLDEVDAPLDDSNTERFCDMVKRMSGQTQFLFISHNKIAMEMAEQLVGVTMQESGVSRVVEVDIQEALRMREQVAA